MSDEPRGRRDRGDPNRGRRVVLGLLLLIVTVIGYLVWLGMTNRGGMGDGVPLSTRSMGAWPSAAPEIPAPGGDGGRLSKTISDRRVRDELRRRILAGWARGEGEAAEAARSGHVPVTEAGPDGGLSREYIQKVIREDFFPMANGCYEELLSRRDAAAGRLEVKFKIVGDEKSGGILEDVDVVNDGGLSDERLTTCIRESMLSVAFEPPPSRGWVTVTYPIEMSPDEPPDR